MPAALVCLDSSMIRFRLIALGNLFTGLLNVFAVRELRRLARAAASAPPAPRCRRNRSVISLETVAIRYSEIKKVSDHCSKQRRDQPCSGRARAAPGKSAVTARGGSAARRLLKAYLSLHRTGLSVPPAANSLFRAPPGHRCPLSPQSPLCSHTYRTSPSTKLIRQTTSTNACDNNIKYHLNICTRIRSRVSSQTRVQCSSAVVGEAFGSCSGSAPSVTRSCMRVGAASHAVAGRSLCAGVARGRRAHD
ncbi:hypothetical protein EVAR_43494_1 [Eumeta japonica]|uniref:Uncharacterized protein n=1 Tax=Eumeta variegata TaxID=151549 RepID=A0A4C1YHM4_EUMVA|nr:hypothetical protein EVAR_43494_1 [Eumeta japonica]